MAKQPRSNSPDNRDRPEPDRKRRSILAFLLGRVQARQPETPERSHFGPEPDGAKKREQMGRNRAKHEPIDVNSAERPASFDVRKGHAKEPFAPYRESASDEIKRLQVIKQDFKTEPSRAGALDLLEEADLKRQEAMETLKEDLKPYNQALAEIRNNPSISSPEYAKALREMSDKAYKKHAQELKDIDKWKKEEWAQLQADEWKVNFSTKPQVLLTFEPTPQGTESRGVAPETVIIMPDDSASDRLKRFNSVANPTTSGPPPDMGPP